ncbi:MAG TPA: phosphotransferase [Steroidobacteraceae bacterium]|nr:phosphotransferase [Steroidobacteraceae bacterium]
MGGDVESFMATMVARSRIPIASAIALARDCYGLETRAVRLTGERDENFKLSIADGTEYVLKIANAAEEQAVGELLTAALQHVERADPTFPCPRVVPARDGRACVRFVDASGAERSARLLTYLPGRLLGATSRSRWQRAACGRIAGRLSNALRSFEHPAARRVIVWDVRHAAQVRALLAQLPDRPYREAADDVLGRVAPRIESRLPRLRRQVVHNDLNPRNILVDPADEARVTGIIDFGDMTYTALIADVAVTAAELLPEDCTAGESARESIRDVALAYHEAVPLLEEELSMLGSLVAARLAANVVVPDWHMHRNPSGDHYAVLDPHFIRARLQIAQELLLEEIRL